MLQKAVGLFRMRYNEIDEHTVNIFHAMICRTVYYPLINRQEI